MSAKFGIYMPLYLGDYRRDTGGLSCEEHGAYLGILMELWGREGRLPMHPERICRAIGLEVSRWESVWAAIARYFQVADGEITQKRVTEELEAARTRRAAAVGRGQRGASARWTEHAPSNACSIDQASQKNACSISHPLVGDSSSYSYSEEDPDTSPLTRSALLEPNQPLSGPISSAPDQTRAIPGTTSTVLPAPTPVRARKSKPAAGADKPPNLHESLTLAFCEAWAARYHEAYAPTPADKSQLGRLLSARPPPEAVAALPVAFGNYLDDQDRWIADTHRHSLAFFCTSGGLNKYRTSSRLAGMDDKQRRGVSALQGWLRNTGEGSNAAE